MPDYSREELVTELKRRRATQPPLEMQPSHVPLNQPVEGGDLYYHLQDLYGPKKGYTDEEVKGGLRSIETRGAYQPTGLQREPDVPEWAGKYPNVYGGLGAAREAIQPFMRGSLVDVGLSKAVGYPTPEFMTEEEAMMLPIQAGLFPKPVMARPQVWIKQHPQSGQFMAQQGMGAEGRFLTSGSTLEDVMKKAKTMAPGHDIKLLK